MPPSRLFHESAHIVHYRLLGTASSLIATFLDCLEAAVNIKILRFYLERRFLIGERMLDVETVVAARRGLREVLNHSKWSQN